MRTKFIAAVAAAITVAASGAAVAQNPVSFKEDVQPLLNFRCGSCHLPGGEGLQASGFDVGSYETVMKGTKFGPMIAPGEPQMSNLMVLLDGKAKIRMPHGKRPLSTCDRDMIRTWILQGAENN
jgi:hypothetical protein